MPEIDAESPHESVLLEEVIDLLQIDRGGIYIDATLGAGGHAEAILERSRHATVLGIDQDDEALTLARARVKGFGERFRSERSNFSRIAEVASRLNVTAVKGILADLGVSSMQLDSSTRGFSFRYDAPLDMRMDPTAGETAADLLATLDEVEIANLIYRYGEERFSRRIARRIVERRDRGEPVMTTGELVELVKRSVPHSRDQIHPATRTFQALRIAVNHELDILDEFINDSVDLLETNGVLAIITFHSLEDRIVKQSFLKASGKCQCPPRIPQCVCGAKKRVEIITKKPVVPTQEEQQRNPRSRSAKLRACRRVEN